MKKKVKFKVGDRVWFEGRKYTLIKSTDLYGKVYPFKLKGIELTFTKDGRSLQISTKPSLKLVKKKKKDEIYIPKGNIIALDMQLKTPGSLLLHTPISRERLIPSDIRYIRAKDQKRDK